MRRLAIRMWHIALAAGVPIELVNDDWPGRSEGRGDGEAEGTTGTRIEKSIEQQHAQSLKHKEEVNEPSAGW